MKLMTHLVQKIKGSPSTLSESQLVIKLEKLRVSLTEDLSVLIQELVELLVFGGAWNCE